ncbi:unnamed protein product, partial [Sphacelaria rigidula]
QTELEERRKALENGEKEVQSRAKHAARKSEAEHRAAKAALDDSRKALARDRDDLAARLRDLGEREQRRARETAAEAESAARKGAEAESLMRRAKERERETVEKEKEAAQERLALESERRALVNQRAALEKEAQALQQQVAALLHRRSTQGEGSSGEAQSEQNTRILQEAESRLRQAEQRHRAAEEREAAASELEGALRADRRGLSLRESAVSAAEARALSRERAAQHLEERLKVELASATAAKHDGGGKPLSSTTAAPSTGLDGGASSSQQGQDWASRGGQLHSLAQDPSLAPGTSIPRLASPSVSLGWNLTHARLQDRVAAGVEGAAATTESIEEQRERTVEERERHLEEWSTALAEQAGAMREQAMKLEVAYDQLRQREGMDSTEPPAEDRAPAALAAGLQAAASEGTAGEDCGDAMQRPEQTGYRRTASSPTVRDVAEAVSATEAPAPRSNAVRATRNPRDEALDRQLEQETVRLAEKAQELEAERRRLAAASEVADREHARAQTEKQEASEARKSAAAFRLQLEREKTKLDAEREGLAAEKSLLAAERDRLETERARARREAMAFSEDPLGVSAEESGRGSPPASVFQAAVDRRDVAGTVATGGTAPPPPRVDGSGDVGNTGATAHDLGGASLALAQQVNPSPGLPSRPTPDTAEPPNVRLEGSGGSDGGRNTAETQLDARLGMGEDPKTRGGDQVSGPSLPHGDTSEHVDLGNSVKVLVQEMATELGRQPIPRRDLTSPGRLTEPAGGNASRKPSSSTAHNAPAGADEGNRGVSSRSTSPRASSARRRQHQRNSGVLSPDNPRVSSRRNSRRGGQGGRRGETENTRGVTSSGGPSLDSIRRRLHAPTATARVAEQREGSDTSADEGDFSSSIATPARRPTGGRSTSASPPAARVVGGQHHEDTSPGASPPMTTSLRPGVTVASTVSKTGASAAHEDPFLAQLHARLAGADHTLRESLGRREALINRFGHSGGSGGMSSSMGPSEGEDTTSDFPSGSPEATTSNGSSPADAAAAHRATAIRDVHDATRQERVEPQSTPDSPGIRGRFGFS